MLTALNDISSQQSQSTQETMNKCKQFMDYAATYPNSYIQVHASDMILMLDTDASYLVIPKALIRIAGYYYLTNKPNARPHPILNFTIPIECKTLKHVVASTAEVEIREKGSQLPNFHYNSIYI